MNKLSFVLTFICILCCGVCFTACDEKNISTPPEGTTTAYTITWKNYDDTVLETDTDVASGATPTYDGATPVKPEDNDYTYTFSGWNPEVVAASADATYTATFNRTAKSSGEGQQQSQYLITWKNWDNGILSLDQVNAGVVPTYDGDTPTKPEDENYTYTFSGWTPTPVAATANTTYTATFTAVAKAGENPDQYFVNKKFTIASINCDNATVLAGLQAEFSDAYACIFTSGLFQLVNTSTNYLSVMIGEYTLSPDGKTVTLTIKKLYDGEEDVYFLLGTNEYDAIATFADDTYTLSMVEDIPGVGVVPYTITLNLSQETPMYADIPSDPNGDGFTFDAQYQVYKYRWNELFASRGNLSNESFTMTSVFKSHVLPEYTYTYQVDCGKYHYTVTGENGVELYYDVKTSTPVYDTVDTTLITGYPVDFYCRSNGVWEKQATENVYYYFFDELGLLPIDFSKMHYSQELHYYSCNSVRFNALDDPTQQRNIYNFRVWFENNQLKKITFTEDGLDHEYNFSNQGSTSVTLPTLPSTNPTDYYSEIDNKVFAFVEAEGDGFGGVQGINRANEIYADSKVQLYPTDGSERIIELKVFNEYDGANVVACPITRYGTYNLFQYGGTYVRGNAVFTSMLRNDIYTLEETESYPYRYIFANQKVRVQIASECYLWFSLTNLTPSPTIHPEPAPQITTWPTTDIQGWLETWEVKHDSIPTFNSENIDHYFIPLSNGSSFEIEIYPISTVTGNSLWAEYYDTFSAVFTSFDVDTGYYSTSIGEILIDVDADDDVLTLTVYPGTIWESASAWPNDLVAEFESAFGFSSTVPAINNATTYECLINPTGFDIRCTFDDSDSANAALTAYDQVLAENTDFVLDNNIGVYVGADGLCISGRVDGNFVIISIYSSQAPQLNTWPSAAIQSYFDLWGIQNDSIPVFESENIDHYAISNFDGMSFDINIYPISTATGNSLMLEYYEAFSAVFVNWDTNTNLFSSSYGEIFIALCMDDDVLTLTVSMGWVSSATWPEDILEDFITYFGFTSTIPTIANATTYEYLINLTGLDIRCTFDDSDSATDAFNAYGQALYADTNFTFDDNLLAFVDADGLCISGRVDGSFVIISIYTLQAQPASPYPNEISSYISNWLDDNGITEEFPYFGGYDYCDASVYDGILEIVVENIGDEDDINWTISLFIETLVDDYNFVDRQTDLGAYLSPNGSFTIRFFVDISEGTISIVASPIYYPSEIVNTIETWMDENNITIEFPYFGDYNYSSAIITETVLLNIIVSDIDANDLSDTIDAFISILVNDYGFVADSENPDLYVASDGSFMIGFDEENGDINIAAFTELL